MPRSSTSNQTSVFAGDSSIRDEPPVWHDRLREDSRNSVQRTNRIAWLVAAISAALLAGYVYFGSELRYMLSSYGYHRQLVDMVLHGRSFGSWLLEILTPSFS